MQILPQLIGTTCWFSRDISPINDSHYHRVYEVPLEYCLLP